MSLSAPDLVQLARRHIAGGQEVQALDIVRGLVGSETLQEVDWLDVMQICDVLGDEDASAEAARRYGASAPGDPRRAMIYTEKLAQIGKSDEALRVVDHFARAFPDDPAVAYTHGLLSAQTGAFDQSEAAFRKALSLKPDLADAWLQIGTYRALADHSTDLDAVRKLSQSTAPHIRIPALFALGKAYHDADDPRRAASAWQDANASLARKRPFDPAILERMASACSDFSKHIPNTDQSDPASLPCPIFILGAPRTGTTLVEHILSAHPRVYALGESLISRVATWPVRHLAPAHLHEAERRFGDTVWSMMGTAYTTLARNRTRSADFVTDKAAMLHLSVGVLACALPHARFVWVRRTPQAAAFSAYRTYFRSGNAWSCDLRQARTYLQAHTLLMTQWAARLEDRMHQICYETLVRAPADEIAGLVKFAELPAHQVPLNFHLSRRSVNTASLAQVRKPIKADQVEIWRKYEAFIPSLADWSE